jgi:hypothetical protein
MAEEGEVLFETEPMQLFSCRTMKEMLQPKPEKSVRDKSKSKTAVQP